MKSFTDFSHNLFKYNTIMNNTKFTPGPWKVHSIKKNEFGVDVARIDAQSEEYVAEVYLSVVGSDKTHNLIAAAPDMYEALETLIDWFDNGADWFEYPEKRDQAKAVLLKANPNQ